MIVFEKITFRNFLATGNKPLTFHLNTPGSLLISGANGSGKSTIFEALYYALYGKAFRKVKQGELINNVNRKELETTVNFTIGRNKYKIVRGAKPDIFEIYINGHLRPMDARKNDYQNFLETNILKMNTSTFRQIVVLGSNSYVPFMKLSKYDRRVVIEEILDIQMFSEMNQIVKKRISVLKNALLDLLTDIKIKKNSYKIKLDHFNELQSLSDTQRKEIKKAIAEAEHEVETLLAEAKKLDTIIQEKLIDTNKMSEWENKRNKINTFMRDINKSQSKLKAEIDFYEKNDFCQTCEQEISEKVKSKKISEKKALTVKSAQGLQKGNALLEQAENEIAAMLENLEIIKTHESRMNVVNLTINERQKEIKKLNNDLTSKQKNNNKDNDKRELHAIEKNIEAASNEALKMKQSGEYYSVLIDILKDDGLKGRIVKKYLPSINSLIRKYLDILEFSCEFLFDENFNETIKMRSRDTFSYGSFSDGQKLRIDLCLLFTWRELARLKNSASTNLLILDEIGSSSLDVHGFDAFNKIIEETTNTTSSKVIVISHDTRIADKFDQVIEVKRENGFTCLVEN